MGGSGAGLVARRLPQDPLLAHCRAGPSRHAGAQGAVPAAPRAGTADLRRRRHPALSPCTSPCSGASKSTSPARASRRWLPSSHTPHCTLPLPPLLPKQEAEETCEGGATGECAAAWDTVEELSAAASHAKEANASTDPLEDVSWGRWAGGGCCRWRCSECGAAGAPAAARPARLPPTNLFVLPLQRRVADCETDPSQPECRVYDGQCALRVAAPARRSRRPGTPARLPNPCSPLTPPPPCPSCRLIPSPDLGTQPHLIFCLGQPDERAQTAPILPVTLPGTTPRILCYASV